MLCVLAERGGRAAAFGLWLKGTLCSTLLLGIVLGLVVRVGSGSGGTKSCTEVGSPDRHTLRVSVVWSVQGRVRQEHYGGSCIGYWAHHWASWSWGGLGDGVAQGWVAVRPLDIESG